jgi:hypothetical protein
MTTAPVHRTSPLDDPGVADHRKHDAAKKAKK